MSTNTDQAWEVLVSQWGRRTHLTEEGKLVIREKPVGLIQEKISADEFFESPVFALHKPICPLTLWGEKKESYLGLLEKPYEVAGCEKELNTE